MRRIGRNVLPGIHGRNPAGRMFLNSSTAHRLPREAMENLCPLALALTTRFAYHPHDHAWLWRIFVGKESPLFPLLPPVQIRAFLTENQARSKQIKTNQTFRATYFWNRGTPGLREGATVFRGEGEASRSQSQHKMTGLKSVTGL